MFPHDDSIFRNTFKHVTVKLGKSSNGRQKYAMWKKTWFLKLSLYMPVKPFYKYCLIYIMDICMVMVMSNLVYKSLDVRCIVFVYKFRERDDVGACCNIVLGVGCNTDCSVDFWDESWKVWHKHQSWHGASLYIYKSIMSDLPIEKVPRWGPFPKMATPKFFSEYSRIMHVIEYVKSISMANHARYKLPRVSLRLAPCRGKL